MHEPEPVRILVVDDELMVQHLIGRWLSGDGYECESAGSAEEASGILEDRQFSLLVTDVNMPGRSGMDLLVEANRRWPDMAVIMVTAVDERATAIRALQLGAYGYMTKPFDKNEVVINVVNALERRRLVRESREYERVLEQRVREQTKEIRESREEIVLRLVAAQECRHDETGAHIRRTGLYAEAMAQRMGRPRDYAEMLRLAAPMHDVAKVGIPDAILLKPGKLTPEEWQIMKTHTTEGARILSAPDIPLMRMARQIALSHHEKWDGSGYPQGLAGDRIPEPARIVAILDVYDALVHKRVYRPALPEAEALDIIFKKSPGHFDPTVTELFFECLPGIREIREKVRDESEDAAHGA